MAWPSTVVAGSTAILASQFNGIVSAFQSWGGSVSANSNPLTDLPSVGLHCTNASWQEFQFLVTAGGSQPLDTLALQYNLRTTSGGADSWSSFASIAVSNGALTLLTPVALNGGTTLGAGLNLNGQTVSGAGTFSGALSLANVTFSSPANIAIASGWQSWTSTFTCSGSMTVSGTVVGSYIRIGPWVFFTLSGAVTLGGTASGSVFFTLPVNVAGVLQFACPLQVDPAGGNWQIGVASVGYPSASQGNMQLGNFGNNFPLGSCIFLVSGFYRCA
jgi:hypothetical protein